jgi:hypothetical protein
VLEGGEVGEPAVALVPLSRLAFPLQIACGPRVRLRHCGGTRGRTCVRPLIAALLSPSALFVQPLDQRQQRVDGRWRRDR